jgi:hypothetical protein
MAEVLPSEVSMALRGPRLTEVDTAMSTDGPGVTVSTSTAAAYRSQVDRVMGQRQSATRVDERAQV